jgi:hypothetical protein
MKKVRYLAGAVGVAPVLGLMLPPGNGEAAVAHAPVGKGKAVSLAHLKLAGPDIGGCRNPGFASAYSSRGLSELVSGTLGASCISFVAGILHGRHLDLDMRTRFYSYNGRKIGGDHFNVAHYVASHDYTYWNHTTSVNAWRACIALVLAANHNSKKYGAICASI